MLKMAQVHQVRELYFNQGKNLTQIAEEMDCDWRTVRKYVDQDDFSAKPPVPASKMRKTESKLDPFKPTIDKWLNEDKKASRKQRHTALRVYDRLTKEVEGFNCSYRTVATYVAKRKVEIYGDAKKGYIPLIHHPGEAQADFGYADFYENGKLYQNAKFLVLSFPFSNGGYLQLNYGENMECLTEGLIAMFTHIGGVPQEIWFDNTKTIVTEIIKGGERKTTESFDRFCEHFRFKPVFMNANSGNEKGNVENKVGYLRRNELVPVPRFYDLAEKNAELLANCDKDMEREHYDDDQHRLISEIFQEDKAALLPLPSVSFDTSRYDTAKTDKYGKFTLDKGKHRYSVSPDFCEEIVRLRITSSKIIVLDTEMREIVQHRRLYGDETESMNWIPYLKSISRKPRSLMNSGIFELMPESLQGFIVNATNSDRRQILKALLKLTEQNGWDRAVNTVNEAAKYGAVDPDSLQSLYRRIYDDIPPLPPLNISMDDKILYQEPIPFVNDLASLDVVLNEGRC